MEDYDEDRIKDSIERKVEGLNLESIDDLYNFRRNWGNYYTNDESFLLLDDIDYGRYISNLINSILVNKSYTDRSILEYNKKEGRFYYLEYLGAYLAYVIEENDEEMTNRLLNKINKLLAHRDNDYGFYIGFVSSLGENRTDIIIKFINLMKKLRDDVYIIFDVIRGLPSGLLRRDIKPLFNNIFNQISFNVDPVYVIKFLIDPFSNYSLQKTNEDGILFNFLIEHYTNKDELTFNEVIKLINEKGSNNSKKWLEKTVLNQI